jgi:hypothetical protein
MAETHFSLNMCCLNLEMKGINTYKLCERNYLMHQYIAWKVKKKITRARTTCQQYMTDNHTYLKMIKGIKNQALSVRMKI